MADLDPAEAEDIPGDPGDAEDEPERPDLANLENHYVRVFLVETNNVRARADNRRQSPLAPGDRTRVGRAAHRA